MVRRFWRLWLLLGLLVIPRMSAAVSVQLAWDYVQGADPAIGFFVYKQVGCTGTFVKMTTTALPFTPLAYTDTAVSAGQTFCWKMTAVDAKGGESTFSNVLTFSVPAPAPPTNLRGILGP